MGKRSPLVLLIILSLVPFLSSSAQSTTDKASPPASPPAAGSAGNTPSLPAASAATSASQTGKPDAKPDAKPSSDIRTARFLYRQGKLGLALAAVESSLNSSPASLDAQVLKGEILLAQGRVDEAHAIAAAALQTNPESPIANLLVANVDLRNAEIAQANDAVQKAIKIDSNDAEAWLTLSRIADLISMRKKAKACVEKAYALDSADPEIVFAWAETRATPQEQRTAYEKYLALVKDDAGSDAHWAEKQIDRLKALGDSPTDVLVTPVVHYDIPIDYLLHDADHLRGWGVQVKFGNCKPAKLMIDTGASGIAVNRNLAERCGLRKLYDVKVGGIGDQGPMSAYTAIADRVEIGGVAFGNYVVDVTETRSVADESGLIGPDVFAKFLISLNLAEYKMALDPLPMIPGDDGKDGPKDRYIAPEMAKYARVFQSRSKLLIPTKVGDDTKSALFLIDTGALVSNIDSGYVRQLEKLHQEQFVEMKGVSGKVQNVFSADFLTLQFAGFRQMNQSLISLDLNGISDHTGVRVSGLLGLTALRWFTLKIDYRDGLVGFEFHEPKGVDDHRLR